MGKKRGGKKKKKISEPKTATARNVPAGAHSGAAGGSGGGSEVDGGSEVNAYAPSLEPASTCGYCDAPGAVLRCGACRTACYCDAKCQALHWKTGRRCAKTRGEPHKAECKRFRAERKADAGDARLDFMAYDRRGTRFLIKGDFARAASEFELAVQGVEALLASDPPPPPSVRDNFRCIQAAAHHNLGTALLSQGGEANVERACVELRRAVEVNPEYEKGHYGLANALQAVGDVAGAIRSLQEVVRLGARQVPNAHHQLSKLLLDAADTEDTEGGEQGTPVEMRKQALQASLCAVEVEPTGASYFQLAMVWSKHGALKPAIESLRHSLALREDAQTRFMLENFESIQRQVEEGMAE